MIRLRVTIFSENIQFFFLVLCLALNFNNYLKVCLISKYTIFCQNNCQNAQFGPFYQFTLGLSLVFVFSHRLLNYFAENIFCSVFKTEISLFLQKKQTCFSVEFSVFVNFSEKFCKNRTFLPYFRVFRQISSRSCEKHVVSS